MRAILFVFIGYAGNVSAVCMSGTALQNRNAVRTEQKELIEEKENLSFSAVPTATAARSAPKRPSPHGGLFSNDGGTRGAPDIFSRFFVGCFLLAKVFSTSRLPSDRPAAAVDMYNGEEIGSRSFLSVTRAMSTVNPSTTHANADVL